MKDSGLLFSIVIPLYNKGKYIADTMASVLSQTYADFEVIVVDDGSTDNGGNVVKSIADNRIKYFYKDNGGVSSARNYGVAKANGEWIYILDADDFMMPNALEFFFNVLASFSGKLDVVTGGYIGTTDGKSTVFKPRKRGIAKNNYRWFFMNKLYLRAGNCIVRREIIQAYPYDESLSRFEDTEHILRMLGDHKVYVIPDLVLEYRHVNGGAEQALPRQEQGLYVSVEFQGKAFLGQVRHGRTADDCLIHTSQGAVVSAAAIQVQHCVCRHSQSKDFVQSQEIPKMAFAPAPTALNDCPHTTKHTTSTHLLHEHKDNSMLPQRDRAAA